MSESGCILKEQLTGFADGLTMKCVCMRDREDMISQEFWLQYPEKW